MVFTRDIRIKVTQLQFEIIKNKAQLAGKKTMAAYIRKVITNEDFSIENLVKEIHTMIVQEQRLKKK